MSRLFRDLGVKHDPLKLITPQFETPLPPLQVFENSFKKLFCCLGEFDKLCDMLCLYPQSMNV